MRNIHPGEILKEEILNTVVRQNRKQVVNSSETLDFTGSCCRFSKAGGAQVGPNKS